jgi:peptidoglycan hydrolase FlgJ
MVAPLGFDAHLSASMPTTGQLSSAGTKAPQSFSERARKQSVDFEANFLNSMFESMFTDIKGDGPMGAGQGVGVWRSFLVDEYSKSFAKAGGVGIANQVYKSLMAHQEAHAK